MTRSRRPTSATRPTPSTTSTPTACPTGSTSTSRAVPPSVACRPARWARPGATGTPWTTSSTTTSSATSPARSTSACSCYDGDGVNFDRTEPIDCQVGQKVHLCNGGAHRPPRRLHLRRLRQGRRRPRGAQRRRDLGPDPVEPAPRDRLEALRGARHPRDGAGAVQPVVPRHAQRDPGRRHLALRRQEARRDLEGVRQPRHGLLRRLARRRRLHAERQLRHPAEDDHHGQHHGHGHRLRQHRPGRGRPGDPGLPGLGHRQPDGGDRRPTAPTRSRTCRTAATASSRSSARATPVAQSVTVAGTGTTTKNFSVRKDLATRRPVPRSPARRGVVFQGCGPKQAVDQNLATGWSTNVHSGTSTDPTNQFDPKSFVVKLDKAYDVKGFAVDPSASCGDGGSASTGGYTIETSPDNSTWTQASAGTFTTADDGHLNSARRRRTAPAAVQYVRFTVTSNQTPDFAHQLPERRLRGLPVRRPHRARDLRQLGTGARPVGTRRVSAGRRPRTGR